VLYRLPPSSPCTPYSPTGRRVEVHPHRGKPREEDNGGGGDAAASSLTRCDSSLDPSSSSSSSRRLTHYLFATCCSPRLAMLPAQATLEDVIIRRAARSRRQLDEGGHRLQQSLLISSPPAQPAAPRPVSDLRPMSARVFGATAAGAAVVRSVVQDAEDLNLADHMRSVRCEQRRRRARRSPPKLMVKLPVPAPAVHDDQLDYVGPIRGAAAGSAGGYDGQHGTGEATPASCTPQAVLAPFHPRLKAWDVYI
jgi:hypothetical protein